MDMCWLSRLLCFMQISDTQNAQLLSLIFHCLLQAEQEPVQIKKEPEQVTKKPEQAKEEPEQVNKELVQAPGQLQPA